VLGATWNDPVAEQIVRGRVPLNPQRVDADIHAPGDHGPYITALSAVTWDAPSGSQITLVFGDSQNASVEASVPGSATSEQLRSEVQNFLSKVSDSAASLGSQAAAEIASQQTSGRYARQLELFYSTTVLHPANLTNLPATSEWHRAWRYSSYQFHSHVRFGNSTYDSDFNVYTQTPTVALATAKNSTSIVDFRTLKTFIDAAFSEASLPTPSPANVKVVLQIPGHEGFTFDQTCTTVWS